MEANVLTPETLQDVDILISQYQGVTLKRPIAVEVNGLFHYPRNSELPLGKDLIKTRFLE
jgi:hypothetical protein